MTGWALLALVVTVDYLPPNQEEDRVSLTDIVQSSQDGQRLNSRQVGNLLRDLGFETRKAGNEHYVFTGGWESLVAVARKLGGQDEWIEQTAD
jgi:hypothetical protein